MAKHHLPSPPVLAFIERVVVLGVRRLHDDLQQLRDQRELHRPPGERRAGGTDITSLPLVSLQATESWF